MTYVGPSLLNSVSGISFLAGQHVLFKIKGSRASGEEDFFLLFDRVGSLIEIDEEMQKLLTASSEVTDSKLVSKNHSMMTVYDRERFISTLVDVRYYESK